MAPILEFVFDAPRHEVPVAGKKVHAPNGMVGKILLDVGKTGDGFPFSKIFAVAQFCVTEYGSAMAEGAGNLSGFIELDELPVASHAARTYRQLSPRAKT